MRKRENLKALEQTLEREVLEFWTWLGAAEAPETWESASPALSEQAPADQEIRTALPPDPSRH